MNSPAQPQVVIIQVPKSPMLAAVLGFFFGPLGLLYVGFVPALIMFGVNVVVAIFTVGIGLFLTWPLCAIVGWSRANLYNKKLMAGQ
jgi:hypothetical protein